MMHTTEMSNMPPSEVPIFRAVLAEWAQHGAILECKASQLQRAEQLWNILWLLSIGKEGSSCRWILEWREVGDIWSLLVDDGVGSFVSDLDVVV